MFGIGMPELLVLLVIVGIPAGIVYFVRRGRTKTTEPRENGMPVVSAGRRLANFIIDLIIFRIAAILLLLPIADTDFFRFAAQNQAAGWMLGLTLYFLYYFIFETLFQRTPAKFITGTKVIMLDGSKPNAASILKRSLSRLVPFEPLSGDKGTWWHDRWTQTLVVKV